MKLTEKALYETWLDIKYADEINQDALHDFEIEIKELKKHRNKTKKLLIKAVEQYKKIYGEEPKIYKRVKGE